MSNILQLKPKVKKYNIGCIVQARMTSKRFPGKSMAMLHGKPVLAHCLERVRLIQGLEYVVLACPDTEDSEPMLQLALSMTDLKHPIKYIYNFCGSEENVLERYYKAAMFFKLDVIMRITGDCPFIDPRVCFEVLHLLAWRKLDYCSNIFPVRTYPIGFDCEVFTMDCLEAANQMAETDYDKEHVTSWMQRTPEIKRANVAQKIDASHKNFCVDYPEDIKRLEKEIKKSVVMKVGGLNDNKAN